MAAPWIDITRYLPKHPTKRYTKRPTTGYIETIVIHHSADDGDPWSWARYHVDTHGWPGIAYHIAVMRDGTVFKTNLDSTLSYHAGAKYNPISFGICFAGNLINQRPTVAQLASGLVVVDHYVKAYKITDIIGHRDAMPGSTACPGSDWLVAWLRQGIAA